MIGNNAYATTDLEHVNLIQIMDTNGFIRRVYAIFTSQMIFSTAVVALRAHNPALMEMLTGSLYIFVATVAIYVACDLVLLF